MTSTRHAAFVAVLMLAGCASPQPVPDSGAGVGFGDYASYELERARREAQLTGSGSTTFGTPAAGAPAATFGAPPPVNTQAIPSSELAAAGIGQAQGQPLPGALPPQSVGAPLSAISPAATLPAPDTNNPGISDENEFDAVASRETIQSDAERRAQQAAARQVIAPTALPDRPTDTGPNIVAYALNAPNVKGQEWYSRSLLSGQGRFQRNCASYNSADEAQRDFLARGGPDRDPRGLDPDGDGFACGWDPQPFRLAAGGN